MPWSGWPFILVRSISIAPGSERHENRPMEPTHPQTRKGPPPPDISERGGAKDGQPQRSDERLFMQLLVYGGCRDAQAVRKALAVPGVEGALYEDAKDRKSTRLNSSH